MVVGKNVTRRRRKLLLKNGLLPLLQVPVNVHFFPHVSLDLNMR